MVHSKSWLSPLPDQIYEVRSLLEEHNKRVRRKEFNLSSSVLSAIRPPPVTSSGDEEEHENSLRLGNGLAEFIHSSTTTTAYEGIVQVVEPTLPEYQGDLSIYPTQTSTGYIYRCIVTIADESACIQVIVPNSSGEVLFGMPAAEAAKGARRKEPFNSQIAWSACLQAVHSRGQRFFILKSIRPVD